MYDVCTPGYPGTCATCVHVHMCVQLYMTYRTYMYVYVFMYVHVCHVCSMCIPVLRTTVHTYIPTCEVHVLHTGRYILI